MRSAGKKSNEPTTADEQKPRRKSRWDVESQPEDFEHAPPVMWEVEGNIWPKLTAVDNAISMMGGGNKCGGDGGDTAFSSPLLEAVSARVKDETAKLSCSVSVAAASLLTAYTPAKDNIVDSPESLRRKMEEIAMLERALSAKDLELMRSPGHVVVEGHLAKQVIVAADTLDLEAPKLSEIVSFFVLCCMRLTFIFSSVFDR